MSQTTKFLSRGLVTLRGACAAGQLTNVHNRKVCSSHLHWISLLGPITSLIQPSVSMRPMGGNKVRMDGSLGEVQACAVQQRAELCTGRHSRAGTSHWGKQRPRGNSWASGVPGLLRPRTQ